MTMSEKSLDSTVLTADQKDCLEVFNAGHCVSVTPNTWTRGGHAKSSDVAASMAKFLDSLALEQQPK